jgi:hypothetical protein
MTGFVWLRLEPGDLNPFGTPRTWESIYSSGNDIFTAAKQQQITEASTTMMGMVHRL